MLTDYEFAAQANLDAANYHSALEDIIDFARGLPHGSTDRDKRIADFATAHAYQALMGPGF